jgi:hypothetical protein
VEALVRIIVAGWDDYLNYGLKPFVASVKNEAALILMQMVYSNQPFFKIWLNGYYGFRLELIKQQLCNFAYLKAFSIDTVSIDLTGAV